MPAHVFDRLRAMVATRFAKLVEDVTTAAPYRTRRRTPACVTPKT